MTSSNSITDLTCHKAFSLVEVYCSQGVQHSSSTKDKHCSSLYDSAGLCCGFENATSVPADMWTSNKLFQCKSWVLAFPLILSIQVHTRSERFERYKLMLRLKARCWRSPTRKYEEERQGGGPLCGHMLHNQNLAVGRKKEKKKNSTEMYYKTIQANIHSCIAFISVNGL